MPRTYTEAEIAALLARAAERQRHAPEAHSGPTLTLGEIERLAAEAGLDPAHVRAAAAEMDRGAVPASSTPGRIEIERWVDAPFSDVAWEEAVGALRSRHGSNMATYSMMGTPTVPDTSRVGAAHEWKHVNVWYTTTTTATVSPRGNRTRIRYAQSDWTGGSSDRTVAGLWAATLVSLPALLGGIALAAGTDLGGGMALLIAVVLFAAVTLAGALAGAPSIRRARAARAVRAAEAVDEIAAHLEEAAADPSLAATPTPAGPAAEGRVDFDAVVGDEAAGEADEATARRDSRRDAA